MSRSRFPVRAAISLLVASLAATATKAQAPEGTAQPVKDSSFTTTADSTKPQYATIDDIIGVQQALQSYEFTDGRTYTLNTANTARPLGLDGTFQERGTWSQARVNSANGSPAWHKHFDITTPNAIISYGGQLYIDYEEGKNLNYYVDFDAAPTAAGVGVSNGDALQLLDAYVYYNVLRNLALEDSKLQIEVGQQVLPFGLEPQTTQEFKPTILYAQWVTNFGLSSRQVGASIQGDVIAPGLPQVDYGYNYRGPLLQYALGVYDGDGAQGDVVDNNDAKDLLARAVFTVPTDYHSWLRQLAIGGTYYRQWYNLSATSAGTPATTIVVRDTSGKLQTVTTKAAVAGASTLVGLGDAQRFGVDVYYNHQPWGIDYELAYGITDTLQKGASLATGPTNWQNNRGEVKQLGQTLTLFYNWGEQFVKGYRAQGRFDDWWPLSIQPFLRWDRWDPNVDVHNDEIDVWSGGINVFFASTTKVQLDGNLTVRNGPAGVVYQQIAGVTSTATPSSTRKVAGVQAQIQYGF